MKGRAFGAGMVAAAVLAAGLAWDRNVIAVVALVLAGVVISRTRIVVVGAGIILVTAIAARSIVSTLSLSELFNFSYFPLAAVFFSSVVARVGVRAAMRSLGVRWLAGVSVLTLVAYAVTPVHPARTALFFAILGVPLLVMAGVELTERSENDVAALGRLALVLLALQAPIALAQGMTAGWGDPVRGTLTTHATGAHVISGAAALFALVLCGRAVAGTGRMSHALSVGAATVVLIMAAEATQVAVALGIGLLAAIVLQLWNARKLGDFRLVGRTAGVAVAAVAITAATVVFVLPGGATRIARLVTPAEVPVVDVAMSRATSGPLEFAFGSGPGAGASRASVLFTPQLQEETSPTNLLGLGPTAAALDVVDRSLDPVHGGSAENYLSSAMSLLTDLGVVGLVVSLAAITFLVLGFRRPLDVGVRAVLVMTGLLAFVDVWLEIPEFTIPLAIVLGLALRRPSAGEVSA